MSHCESALLAYAFNSLWQVPLACIAAALAAFTLRYAGPRAQHCAWVGGLCAGALFPALSMFPAQQFNFGRLFARALHSHAQGQVSIQIGPGAATGGISLPPVLLHLLAAAWCALLVYFALRFLWRCARVSALARESTPLHLDAEQAASIRRWSSRMGIGPILIAESQRVFAPVALGIRNKTILLPAKLAERLAPLDFDMVIAHELAHIRRNDFLKNLLYELISLPISYHPLAWLIRDRLMETREMVCDEFASQASGKPEYVQSLLRLASLLVHGFARPLPYGISVFDARTFERRLMKLTRNSPRIGHVRKAALVALSLVLAAGAGASALALRLSLDPASLSGDSSPNPGPHSIPPDVVARNIVSKVQPVYPPDAKKARIQGTVVLDAIIGKTGDVENLKVVSGPQELQQSSLDAVRQWKYKPFLLNGEPVEVKSTITVIYSLQK
jgi:TonB family protein